jgi:hypothetical protein
MLFFDLHFSVFSAGLQHRASACAASSIRLVSILERGSSERRDPMKRQITDQ